MTTTISGPALADLLPAYVSLEERGARGWSVHRLPAAARAQIDDRLFDYVEACPVGVALRFRTDGTEVELTLSATVVATLGAEPARVALICRQGCTDIEIALASPTVVVLGPDNAIIEVRESAPETVRIPLRADEPVELLLPHNATASLVALRSEGSIAPAHRAAPRWTHYGSSISQGLDASSSERPWPVSAAHRLGWNLHNLSLAGNAQLDGFVARAIRDAPADIITLKVGINLVNADSMRERTFRPALHAFLDTVREGHPHTPIVLISAIACPIHESAPGPVLIGEDGMAYAAERRLERDEGALTLEGTRRIVAEVVEQRADAHLTYLDGRELLGAADTAYLYDALHPDQGGIDLISDRFVEHIRQIARQNSIEVAPHA